ncbi:DegT/DnrJ/EryC1/StrS family aminotransferase, partial [Rhizobium leguminosarum]|uniref:DegT/DnrJ/EryC1/StrS family aminotransferase n=1 Tax=Rhizobium leguminosarum TaxID=384 RepID=UPI003F9BAA7A
TGEGGMFVTNDAPLYEKVLTLSNHGRARGQTKQFWPDAIGFKYKMSNIQAAIGCAQLERIEENGYCAEMDNRGNGRNPVR